MAASSYFAVSKKDYNTPIKPLFGPTSRAVHF